MTGKSEYSVCITNLRDEDSPVLFEWINNKELVEYNSYFKPVSLENHLKWFSSITGREDVRIFGIRTVQSNKLIGSCQLMNINPVSRSAELQIRLGDFNEMGKGLGTQAVKLLLKFGFEELGLNRIYLHVFSGNERAIRSYLKCGFKAEGVLRKAAFVGDRFVDVKVMSVLKEEYTK